MVKIKSIGISRLDSGNFYQFTSNIVDIAQSEPLVQKILLPVSEWLPQMTESFKKEKQTQETQQIVALDRFRDRAFLKIDRMVFAFLIDDRTPANIVAAEKIEVFIKQYEGADLTRFDYNKESAYITNFVTDVTAHAAAELDTLNLTADVTYLANCNTNFINYYAQRGDAASLLSNVVPFSRLRKQVKSDLDNFLNDVPSVARINPAATPQIEALISRINVEIDKFKLLIPSGTPPANTPPTAQQ